MKKFQTVLLALFAVLAFGAILASTASAETTLAAEWLVNGVVIGAAEHPVSESSGEIKLEDTKLGAAVLCSGILDGTVSAKGVDEITKVLNLEKEEITELTGLALTAANGDCAGVTNCGTPIEVWPKGLPWHTQLFLKENGEFADRITGNNGGDFGYDILCTVLVDITDTCEASEGTFKIENQLEDAAIPANTKVEPNAFCPLGGTQTGVNETDALTLITLASGALLTASE